ncbi:hypothetical protein B0H15DRAFT_790089 [Mycena belliarum]|uniref:Non-ribosomal peptide synthetase n=1 Tax=Mycena belliarum TaxID=1033014 RepID=A0AAD6TRE3_9AGAR|nr:hypothetical protein B0H15DRAFT_790089 [Mycena belliae]
MSTIVARPHPAKDIPPLAFPVKPNRHVGRMIKFRLWFNTYRKFYTLVLTLNIIGLGFAATGKWEYPRRYTGAFILGNLQAAILVRNELFGRLLYLVINTLFAKWPPLWFRLSCTSVLQHLGGIHSGCATSGALWLVFRIVMIFANYHHYPVSITAAGIVTSVAVFISILSALPWVRESYHNVFEGYHRLVGWFGLLSTWVFVVLGDSYDLTTRSWDPNGIRLIRQQDFWFAMGMTIFITIPWVTLRKVPVTIEVPSPKVAIVRFERGMQQGLLARISRGSILEYHAFGIISKGRQSQEHYLICGVQGDFTQSLVDNPPTHLWTRQLKFAGVSNTSKLYKRGIRVCTGTGLGAALSTCLQNPNWYLIWMGSDQAKTFGPTISALIHDNLSPDQYTLWDSKERGGRPDVMQLIKEVYVKWGAEVVFITSNLGGNTEMMRGCKKEGIPAFGTLWDF